MSTQTRSLEQLWAAAYDPKISRTMDYPHKTLVGIIEDAVDDYATHDALDFFGRRTSYAALGEQIRKIAAHLHRLGVRPGDMVALLMPTCPQHIVAFYAVLMCGATVVEHNPLYTSRELNSLFADHRAKVAIVWDAAAQHLYELDDEVRPSTIISINMIDAMPWTKRLLLHLPIAKARTSRNQLSQPAPGTIPFTSLLKKKAVLPEGLHPREDDVALLLYTSGTTGNPKGVPLTHRNLVASMIHAVTWVTSLKPGRDVSLCCLPLFHVFGCSLSMNASLHIGAMLQLIPKPETGLILDAIKKKTPTLVIAVPPLFERIVKGAEERGVSLRGITNAISGAMPLQPDLIDMWESATDGLLIEGYGLSETSPILTGNPVNKTRKAASIGIPFPDTQLRLADLDDPKQDVPFGQPGEILVKGPQVFSGYRNLPEENAAAFSDGWFRTGDVAVPDDDGFLRIVDRIKEVVITGGFNVYPSEVEAAMRGQDGIEDVAVIGLANELGVEEVVAAVVTTDGLLPDLEQLRASVKKRLAAYKVPRKVFLVNELPRNEMGKVQRRKVRTDVEKMDATQRLASMAPEFMSRLNDMGPELKMRFAEIGPMLSEKLESLSPDMRDRLSSIDFDLLQRLEDFAPEFRAWLDRLALPHRLEVFLAALGFDDADKQAHSDTADTKETDSADIAKN